MFLLLIHHISNSMPPWIDKNRCRGSSACADVCPGSVIYVAGAQALVANPDACTECEACVRACPVHAVVLERRDPWPKRVLIVYDRPRGKIASMANHIAAGVKESGCEPHLVTADKASIPDVLLADAVLIGSTSAIEGLSESTAQFVGNLRWESRHGRPVSAFGTFKYEITWEYMIVSNDAAQWGWAPFNHELWLREADVEARSGDAFRFGQEYGQWAQGVLS